jgi:hypothetical protein
LLCDIASTHFFVFAVMVVLRDAHHGILFGLCNGSDLKDKIVKDAPCFFHREHFSTEVWKLCKSLISLHLVVLHGSF